MDRASGDIPVIMLTALRLFWEDDLLLRPDPPLRTGWARNAHRRTIALQPPALAADPGLSYSAAYELLSRWWGMHSLLKSLANALPRTREESYAALALLLMMASLLQQWSLTDRPLSRDEAVALREALLGERESGHLTTCGPFPGFDAATPLVPLSELGR